MSDINFKDKKYLERLLEMGDGYVLDFTNRTMREFISETTNIDIYHDKYSVKGDSKAYRLRAFWEIESNYLVGQLIENLLEYWMTQIHTGERDYDNTDEYLYDECLKIAERLKSGGIVENLEFIRPNVEDNSFEKLAKSIKQVIDNNEPEIGIDRLHTFVTKYIRQLCDNYNIKYEKTTPLHSLFGSYIKHLKSEKLIESEMTERILTSSIKIMETFNKVRNNHSFAHDNEILGYNESLLIFNYVANVIRFIETIENQIKPPEEDEDKSEVDMDFPF